MNTKTELGVLCLDAYYTPDPLAAALVDLLPITAQDTVIEPSCGGGAFVRALLKKTPHVIAVDLNPEAPGLSLTLSAARDFLDIMPRSRPVWVVGNPPYNKALEHVTHALNMADQHVAFLLRLGFLESKKRLEFWRRWPCRKVFVLVERPSFTGGGTDSAAYALFWWDKGHRGATELEIVSWKVSQQLSF